MNKQCIIFQPFGLGDVILSEPIAKFYYKLGYNIIWVIDNKFLNIQNHIPYINFTTNINYFNGTESIFSENYIYLPLISANLSEYEFQKTGWLYSKYKMANLDPENWKSYEYTRNYEKEKKLYDKIILNTGPYIIVNKNSSIGTRNDLQIYSDYRIIEMQNIEDYSLIDWSMILENSEEVHTVSTSLKYVLYKINHKNSTIYRREKNDNTFYSIKDIFNFHNFKYEN